MHEKLVQNYAERLAKWQMLVLELNTAKPPTIYL